MRGKFRLGSWFALLCFVLIGLTTSASAERFTGGSYQIDASVIGNSFGGSQSGGSYQLTSSGGESIIGQGSGGSYRLDSGYVAQLQKSLQLTVQPGNMVAYYALDEPSGSFMRDASFNSNNGSTIGSPSIGAGKIGNAVTLNGSSQYAVGIDNDIASTITLSAWVKPNSGGQTASLIAKRSSTTDNQGTLSLVSGAATFTVTTAGSEKTVTGGALSAGVWTHVVGVYDGTNARLYVNNAPASPTAATGALGSNNFAWTIGRNANAASGYFSGGLDEIKIFSRALSANEVKAEYDAGVAGNTAGLSFAADIAPGVSQTSPFDAAVLTDAKAYSLAINQNQNLTKGADTISAVSGSIGSPVAWVEGTTKGLGFTLFGTNATAIPGTWNSGNSYAAFPGTATTFYNRTGQGTKDIVNMRLRLDVTTAQPAGTYTNVITTTGTMAP